MVEPVAMEVAADVAHGLGHWKLSGGLGQWKLTRFNVPLHCRSEEHLVGVMASGGDWGAEKMGVCGAWTLLPDMDNVRYGAAFEKEIEGRPSTRSIGDLPPEVLNFAVRYAKTL